MADHDRTRNIVKALAVEAKEDVISNLIAYCLDESPEFREVFIRDVLHRDAAAYESVAAHTRVRTSVGVPDIVITLRGPTATEIVIVENKLNAEEGNDQTHRYADEKCVSDLLKVDRIGVSEPTAATRLFLTLHPDQQPRSECFVSITYRTVLACLEQVPPTGPLANRLASDFAAVLRHFYSQCEADDTDRLAEQVRAWRDLDGLDVAHGYFVSAFGALRVAGLERVGSGVFNTRGARNSYIQYSKDLWRPASFSNNDGSDFDAARHFDIHFEVTLRGQRDLVLVLHHHTRPYLPKSQTGKWKPEYQERLEEHWQRRNQFFAAFTEHAPIEFSCHNYDLQIAVAEEIAGRTVQELRVSLERLIAAATPAVDDAVCLAYGAEAAV